MRIVGAAAVAGLLVAGPAAPAPAADALVSGRIVDAGGRPAAGFPVALVAKRNAAADIAGAFAALFTIGITCIAGAPPCDSSPSASATTGADGRYAFDGVQVAQVGAAAVLVAGAPGRPTVRAQLTVDHVMDLGDLPLWEPGLKAASSGPRTTLSWTAPPGADGRTVVHMNVVGTGVGRVAGGATGATGSGTYDRRAVEDRYVEAVLDAGFSRPRGGANVRVDWTSAPRPVPAAGPPPSRGRSCTADGVALSPCPYTDGDLTTVPAGQPKEVVVDLGSTRGVDVAAVAGGGPQASVETSTDRVTWRALPERTDRSGWDADQHEGGGAAARWVRVKPAAAGQPVTFAELSVWSPGNVPVVFPPRPAGQVTPLPGAAPPATSPVAAPPAALPDQSPVVPPSDDVGPLVAAFVALLLVSLATCVVAVRTTRPRPRPQVAYPQQPWGGPPAAGWPVPYAPPARSEPAWPPRA